MLEMADGPYTVCPGNLEICSTLISLWSDCEYLGRHAHSGQTVNIWDVNIWDDMPTLVRLNIWDDMPTLLSPLAKSQGHFGALTESAFYIQRDAPSQNKKGEDVVSRLSRTIV